MNPTSIASESADFAANTLARLANVIDGRHPSKGGQPDTSYVARLLANGPDSFLKKVGEEATEVVMAAKDLAQGGDASKLVAEMADLWFHSLIALSYFGLRPEAVLAELARREGTSGIEEKALRKLLARTQEEGEH